MALQTAQLGQMASFSTPSAIGVQRREPKIWQQALAQALASGAGDVVHAGVGNAMSRDYAPELGQKGATGWDRLIHGPTKTEADYRQAISERGEEGRLGQRLGTEERLSANQIAASEREGRMNRTANDIIATQSLNQQREIENARRLADTQKFRDELRFNKQKWGDESITRYGQLANLLANARATGNTADLTQNTLDTMTAAKAATAKATADKATADASRKPGIAQEMLKAFQNLDQSGTTGGTVGPKYVGGNNPFVMSPTGIYTPNIGGPSGPEKPLRPRTPEPTSAETPTAANPQQTFNSQMGDSLRYGLLPATQSANTTTDVNYAHEQNVAAKQAELARQQQELSYTQHPGAPAVQQAQGLQSELDAMTRNRSDVPTITASAEPTVAATQPGAMMSPKEAQIAKVQSSINRMQRDRAMYPDLADRALPQLMKQLEVLRSVP